MYFIGFFILNTVGYHVIKSHAYQNDNMKLNKPLVGIILARQVFA